MPHAPDLVTLQTRGAIGYLQINNPPLNILTMSTRRAFMDRVFELGNREDLKLVIISGLDRAFSVGSDIHEFPEEMIGGLAKIRFEQYMLDRLEQVRQFTIIKMRGHVLGGGAEIMLCCDLRLASHTTRIGFPEIRLGALPLAGGVRRLVRDIGPVRAKELIVRGQSITGEEAARIGLINRSVPDDHLDSAADVLINELTELPSDALMWAKRCVESLSFDARPDTIAAEAFAALYRGNNLREGLSAFAQKRTPKFDAN